MTGQKFLAGRFGLLLSIALCACTTSPSMAIQKGLPLASQWVLESFPDDQAPVAKNAYINIAPDHARFTGHGGCNTLSGSIKVEGERIAFGRVIATRMACPTLGQESKFIRQLGLSNAYKIDGGRLLLYHDRQLLMTLESFR